ncbi:uncharacterized protein LOC124143483 [Haliotis rufescens]|uniref:uncharacterized protein LOC124143483 n=1 Tax=Haliotis rufescens TaxID=6454 RepID=UPI00201EB054|nr:uncharacterized protein LOC124143483 [Haliotis rufescens]
MAAVRFGLVLSVLLILQTVSVCRGVPVVTGVQSSVEGDMRNITIRYQAETRPVVLWKVGSFLSHFGNTTHTFSDSEGEATLHMYIDPQLNDFREDILTCIYGDSYEINLVFVKDDIINSRLERNNITPLVFSSQPDGIVNFDEDERVDIDLSIESENLGLFEIYFTLGMLNSFDYRSLPPLNTYIESIPVVEPRHSFILPDLNNSRASTVEHTLASIDTSYPYTEGEVKFVVGLRVRSAYSLLDRIIIRRWVYLKNRGHVSPFWNSVSLVDDPQNRHNNEIIHTRFPYTQIDAIGYPKPVLKLFRDCREITEPEVEMITIGTPYRTRKIFRFKNVTDSLQGTYYASASNGHNQVTQMYYIQVL